MASASDAWGEWDRQFEAITDAYVNAVERNVDAQRRFVDAWADSVDEWDADRTTDAVESYGRAFEVWLDATEEAFDRVEDAAAGEEIEPDAFRDIWLDASNRAFKEMMDSEAFAAFAGQTTDGQLAAQRQFRTLLESTLHGTGVATQSDVQEVGERLVEMERRQQRVENRLVDLVAEIEDALAELRQ